MDNKLGIAIPVFNNVLFLKECLKSLELQNIKSFEVFIFDDASDDDYFSVINSYTSLSINYIRNPKNLGALRNMQHAFNQLKWRYSYIMIMHEDDIIHPQFIETVYQSLHHYKDPAFIISNFCSFDYIKDLGKLNNVKYENKNFTLLNKNELTQLFLQQQPLAFGSVIYNTNIYKTMDLNFEKYEEFADRPFLLKELGNLSTIVLLNDSLYYYRSHGLIDNRWKKLLPKNIFNLLKLYQEILVKSGFLTNKIFKKEAMAFIFQSFKNLLLTGKKYSYVYYLFCSKKHGFFSFKFALLKIPFINKLGTGVKKVFS